MAKKKPQDPTAAKPSFEQAIEQLEGIVHQLEEGEIGLDEALNRYEQGVKLLRRCYDLLETAERRIELLSGVDAEGKPISTPVNEIAGPANEETRGRGQHSSQAAPPTRGGSDAEETDMDVSGGLF